MEKEKEAQESSSRSKMKRIYISHDASNKGKEKSAPLLIAEEKNGISNPPENYITVFGVQVPNKGNRSNI